MFVSTHNHFPNEYLYLHLNKPKITMQRGLKPIIALFFLFWESLLFKTPLVLYLLDECEVENYHSVMYLYLTQILQLHRIASIYYDTSNIYVALTEKLTHYQGLLCWQQVVSNFHLLYCIKIDKRVLNTTATLLSVIAVGMLFHHYWDIPQCRKP